MKNKLLESIAIFASNNNYCFILSQLRSYIQNSTDNYIGYPFNILGQYRNNKFPCIIWTLMVSMFGTGEESPNNGFIYQDCKEEAFNFLNAINIEDYFLTTEV